MCAAQDQNLTTKETEQITIDEQETSPLTSYAIYLRGLYSSMSHSHTSQHWSHLPESEFIQLAMIGSKGLRRGDREEEMVRLAQQGRIETIMSHKEQINLNNLFLPPPSPHPRVLLIEGAPGGGKSTLALRICHQWAQYASFMDRFKVVVLLYLRDQAVQKATSLADILPARTLAMSKKVASQIESCDGYNLLFVFDGWDEFPSDLQTNSLISTIIREPCKLSLHQSTVLITSRPVSSGNLLHIADRRVEILGFTQHQIREYIEKALDGNSTHIQKLVQHLEEHRVIEGYCYVPLHVAILVHIFLTMKGALPTTLHELFCNLVLCCIVRELDTHESESDTSEVYSLDDLPDDLISKLSDLCVLAYEGVMQDKVVFYQKDLRKFNLPSNLSSTGLLQAVEGLTLYSKSFSYNFLHLSVQELLAAYCISHLDSSEQMKVFKRMFGSYRFQAVLHYYSGFTKLANPAIRKFISIYSRQQSSVTDLLPLLHCFYEAQEPSLCNLIKITNIELDSRLNPVDYLAIGYFITSLLSSSDVPNVYLKIRTLDNHKLKLLLFELSKYSTGRLSTANARLQLELFNTTITEEEVVILASHLKQSAVISKLIIQYCFIEHHEGMLHIFEALQTNSYLTELQIMCPGLLYKEQDDDGPALEKMLQTNKSLIHFSLSKTRELQQRSQFIFRGLQHNKSIVYLDISNTRLVATEDTAQALTTMLQVNKSLTHLDLSTNNLFSDSGAHCVCQGLQHNTTLVYLNLSNTGITDKGAEYIAQALDSLQTLHISDNNITDSGFADISKSLETNTTLKKLNIDYNPIAKSAVRLVQEKHQQLEIVFDRTKLLYVGACID